MDYSGPKLYVSLKRQEVYLKKKEEIASHGGISLYSKHFHNGTYSISISGSDSQDAGALWYRFRDGACVKTGTEDWSAWVPDNINQYILFYSDIGSQHFISFHS